MSKVRLQKDYRIALPEDFAERRHLRPGDDFWLDASENGVVLLPRRPDVRKLYIEPTTNCNLHCATCVRNVWGDPWEAMSMDTFQHIVEQVNDLPELSEVVFAGFGEALSHRHAFDMIAAMRAHDYAVTVASNGTLLNEKRIRRLIELGVNKLVVSIDGVRPETFESIRDVALQKVLHNLELFNQIKKETGAMHPILEIEFVAMKSNIGDLPAMPKLMAELQASRLIVTNVLAYTESLRDEILYGYAPQSPLLPLEQASWPVSDENWMFWGTVDLPRMHWSAERRCKFIHDRATVVGWDGSVVPCYALSHNYAYYALDGRKKNVSRYTLGNVNEQTLAEIWMSETYTRFRGEVRTFHFPSCPDCDLRETCDLREENEGCWGWNPSCADCLWAQDIIKCP